jgi:nitrite reductase/ring-hydroxylating ferredoxin subunit
MSSKESCTDCPVAAAGRRAFLRDVGLMVATVFAAGAAASPAFALTSSISETRATSSRGLLRTYAVPTSDSISIDLANEVILARWQNRVYAFSLKCPHRGARLEWIESEKRIFCPKHKARFIADGTHASGRASRDLDRYRLSRQGGSVVVELGSVLRADQDADAWKAAVIAV